MAGHIALLGDSIFDNRTYTRGEPDVVTHLSSILPRGYRASLLAVDGAIAAGVPRQLSGVTPDVTNLVVSMGGNDALSNADLLDLPVRSTREALLIFGERVRDFEIAYRSSIGAVLELGRSTTVCTIYDGNLGPREAPVARIALMLFNDVIVRVAHERKLGLVDLRLVCTEPSDYANPIEPSGSGGAKIARAIVASLGLLR
ncbi:MAG TPA: SGNH/GDSL hydrolase family protein [Polyangiaceae bacterium]|nr:SGNH/GDSL hydrolase family protein [Polyangiaceae bacterium]